MDNIQEKLKKLYFQSDSCIRCGRCTVVCPTFAVSKKEHMVARGRIRLAREYVEGNLELTDKLKLYFDLCLGCNACLEICPPRIRTAELLNLIKIDIVQKNGSSLLDSLLLNMVLNSPESLRKKLALLGTAGTLGITKLLPSTLKSKEQLIPYITKKSLKKFLKDRPNGAAKKKYRVGYFIGCLTNALFPGVLEAAIKVLEYHDCEVIIPRDTGCCGLPHWNTGHLKKAQELAKKNINVFLQLQVDYIITDCGTCGYALKNYPDYFSEIEDVKAARYFAEKVLDIHEFLVDVVELKVGIKWMKEYGVTYHDSCHLNREQKVSLQPREILKSIPGLKYIELPEADSCCGGAGSFSVKHQDISMRILEAKMRNINLTKAQYVTAGCPACLMQLDYGCRILGLDIQVKHPIELLAASI